MEEKKKNYYSKNLDARDDDEEENNNTPQSKDISIIIAKNEHLEKLVSSLKKRLNELEENNKKLKVENNLLENIIIGQEDKLNILVNRIKDIETAQVRKNKIIKENEKYTVELINFVDMQKKKIKDLEKEILKGGASSDIEKPFASTNLKSTEKLLINNNENERNINSNILPEIKNNSKIAYDDDDGISHLNQLKFMMDNIIDEIKKDEN